VPAAATDIAATARVTPIDNMFSASYAPAAARGQISAGAYQQVGTQTMVAGASPHHLVSLLFDAFVAAVNRARGAIRERDIEAKGRAIAHASRIVEEGLRGGLNLDAGGRLAADLDALYAYIGRRLLQANLHNDEPALQECLRLVQPLREAWAAIGDSAAARN
jgi:flagellar protein FliS